MYMQDILYKILHKMYYNTISISNIINYLINNNYYIYYIIYLYISLLEGFDSVWCIYE